MTTGRKLMLYDWAVGVTIWLVLWPVVGWKRAVMLVVLFSLHEIITTERVRHAEQPRRGRG